MHETGRRPRTDRVPRVRLGVDERRTAIVDAAAAAFAATPYPEVPVAGVAAAAGASPALVFRYFTSKAGLYAAVLALQADALRARRAGAAADLPPGVPVRDRVGASLHALLDHVAEHPELWGVRVTGGDEPPEALAVREQVRADTVDDLRLLLSTTPGWVRHDYAVAGFPGLVDRLCQVWARQGCPPDHRHALVDTALGALQGALGDWGG